MVVGASPADTAIVFPPSRSAGSLMPESEKTCTDDGVVCRNTPPTLRIVTPLSMLASTAGVSAQPNWTWSAPTACAVFVDPPWPASIFRLIP